MPPISPNSPKAGPAAERIRLTAMFAFAGMLAGVGLAMGAEPELTIKDPWVRFIIAQRPAAGYFTLANGSDKPVTLTGASSPGCAELMLHQSLDQNGEGHMAMLDSVSVPAHGSITFSPGGYHLMCMAPADGTRPGNAIPVTLNFADGQKITTDFPVRNATGK